MWRSEKALSIQTTGSTRSLPTSTSAGVWGAIFYPFWPTDLNEMSYLDGPSVRRSRHLLLPCLPAVILFFGV